MLQFRRIASFLLGAWLAGSVLMDAVAVQNFKSVERFFANPPVLATQDIHALGHDETRILMRHLVAEQNRFYFEHWEWLELAVGFAFVLLLILGSHPPKLAILLALGMFAIVLGQRIGLTPEITTLGRTLDFIPANVASTERSTFWTLHGIYSGVELCKLALGLAIAGLLLIRRNPDRERLVRESELAEIPTVRRAH